MWAFSSWEIITGRRWARKNPHRNIMWRDASGASDAFFWPASWVSNGHFVSGYQLKEWAIEYREKGLSEAVRKCQDVRCEMWRFVTSLTSLSVRLLAALFLSFSHQSPHALIPGTDGQSTTARFTYSSCSGKEYFSSTWLTLLIEASTVKRKHTESRSTWLEKCLNVASVDALC